MIKPDWKIISEACPEPLPKDRKTLEDLVMTHRPDLWAKHQFRPQWSRKKRRLREGFVAGLNGYRWRRDNPHARCADCKHREEYSSSKTGHVCGLGFESGGWYQPVRDDHYCGDFSPAPLYPNKEK